MPQFSKPGDEVILGCLADRVGIPLVEAHQHLVLCQDTLLAERLAHRVHVDVFGCNPVVFERAHQNLPFDVIPDDGQEMDGAA